MKSPPTGFPLISACLVIFLTVQSQSFAQVSVEVPAPEASTRVAGKLLAPRFIKGQTYRFVTTTGVFMQIPGMGNREIRIEQQARLEASARPQGKPGTQIRGLTEKLTVAIRSGKKMVSYDSLKPGDRETTLGKHFQSGISRWVIMQLDPNLRIVEFEEGGSAGPATPLPGMPQYGPEELKQLVATIPQGFAPDPVAPGDEWVLKGVKEVSQAGELNFDLTYRYLGPIEYEGHQTAKIQFSGTMSGEAGSSSFQGTTVVGEMLYDPEAKMIRYMEQTISMSLERPVPGRPGEVISIPMNQKVSSRLLHIVPTKVDDSDGE